MGKARKLQRLKSKGLGPEYTRRILDALCEKVTANNVKLSPEMRPRMLVLPEFKKWERVKKIQTDVYFIAEEYGTRNLMSKIPFILFRQNGITLSEHECVGWHVEHRATYKAKLTQKRFDMCMEKISEMDGKVVHNFFSMMY